MVRQECVSVRSRVAIGFKSGLIEMKEGDPADFVLFGKKFSSKIDHDRRRKTIQEIVYDAGPERSTVRSGAVLSRC